MREELELELEAIEFYLAYLHEGRQGINYVHIKKEEQLIELILAYEGILDVLKYKIDLAE
ncbi:hypothetical protein M0R04_07305 [Candidatus Dojkabacteria bacterium]|nr:hypothetical protein [Candidatus Dojkabacteria bacterium]